MLRPLIFVIFIVERSLPTIVAASLVAMLALLFLGGAAQLWSIYANGSAS